MPSIVVAYRYVSFVVLLSLFLQPMVAQQNDRQQIDSLRNLIPLQDGKEKLDSYMMLVVYLFRDATLEEMTACFDEYDREILIQQKKEEDKSKWNEYISDYANNKLNRGYMYFNRGDFEAVERVARDALEYCIENNQWNWYYKHYDLLLDALLALRKYDSAQQEAKQLYEQAKESNHRMGMVIACSSLADMYYKMDRLPEARKQYEEMVALAEEMEFVDVCYLLVENYYLLIDVLIKLEDYRATLPALQKYESTIYRIEEIENNEYGYQGVNKSERHRLYILYATYYLQTKAYDKTEEYCRLADEMVISEQAGILSLENTAVIRAQMLEAQGKYAEAYQLADKACRIKATASENPLALNECLVLKARLLIRLGRGEESIALYADIHARTDSIRNLDFNRQLDDIRTAYEVDKHIMEIAHQRLYIVIVTVVGLLILLGWIFHSQQMRRKNRALYHQIKERDKLALELDSSVSHKVDSLQGSTQQQYELVARLRKYLLCDRNFAQPNVNRDGLVAALETNRTTLSESVKAVTGKTLIDYIRSLQMEEARQMLEANPNYTIEAIAEASGFNSLSTFYRLFKECYNISPSEYRKIAKRKE